MGPIPKEIKHQLRTDIQGLYVELTREVGREQGEKIFETILSEGTVLPVQIQDDRIKSMIAKLWAVDYRSYSGVTVNTNPACLSACREKMRKYFYETRNVWEFAKTVVAAEKLPKGPALFQRVIDTIYSYLDHSYGDATYINVEREIERRTGLKYDDERIRKLLEEAQRRGLVSIVRNTTKENEHYTWQNYYIVQFHRTEMEKQHPRLTRQDLTSSMAS